MKGVVKNLPKLVLMKIYHPPLIPPIPSISLRTGEGGKVPSPLVGEGLGEGYFRANTITQQSNNKNIRGKY